MLLTQASVVSLPESVFWLQEIVHVQGENILINNSCSIREGNNNTSSPVWKSICWNSSGSFVAKTLIYRINLPHCWPRRRCIYFMPCIMDLFVRKLHWSNKSWLPITASNAKSVSISCVMDMMKAAAVNLASQITHLYIHGLFWMANISIF